MWPAGLSVLIIPGFLFLGPGRAQSQYGDGPIEVPNARAIRSATRTLSPLPLLEPRVGSATGEFMELLFPRRRSLSFLNPLEGGYDPNEPEAEQEEGKVGRYGLLLEGLELEEPKPARLDPVDRTTYRKLDRNKGYYLPRGDSLYYFDKSGGATRYRNSLSIRRSNYERSGVDLRERARSNRGQDRSRNDNRRFRFTNSSGRSRR
jgi:hypothetical protein